MASNDGLDVESSSLDVTASEKTALLEGGYSSSSDLSSSRPVQVTDETLRKTRLLLYLSHFFNQFSENSWQFCLVLFLAAFSNYESLILVSTYGLLSAFSVCYFGPAAGKFIDGTNRLVVAQRFIGLENLSVLAATFCCYLLLERQGDGESVGKSSLENPTKFDGVPADTASIFLLIGIHFLGASAKILDGSFLVAVERDWIVVMSQCAVKEDQSPADQVLAQKKWLSETNVAMKQIDLSCKIVAPAIAGFFVALLDDGTDPHHGSDLRGAAAFVGTLNALALIVEYLCVAKIYYQIPTLAQKSTMANGLSPSGRTRETGSDQKCRAKRPEGLAIYLDQRISWAGIGLSLLYLNVLTFGAIMTAYLVWRGMRLESIGIWRGVSSAAGLGGTFVYHFLSQRMSLVDTGMISIVFQFLCLSFSYASLFIDNFNVSLGMLIGGVCASRIGLWVFDIAVTQLMQAHIPEDIRGLVGGVQQSLNAFFGLLSFALGIVIPNPKDFHYYVSAGYASVALAVLCFALGVLPRKREFAC